MIIVGVGSIAPSGIVARCSQSEEIVGAIDGIQITKQTFGEVSGLPAPVEGTYYIVSRLVAQAATGRTDLLVPGPCIKGEDGRPIGCNGLCVV